MKLRKLFYFTLSGYIAFFIVACKGKAEKVSRERQINVKCEQVVKKSLRPFLKALGTLKSPEEVTVSAEVEGIIKNVLVEEGRAVKKGDLLGEIRERDYDLEVKRSEAILRQAEATLENTRTEYRRKEMLLKEELITRQQFDDVATRLSLAEAELEKAKAGLALAKEKLAKTKIYAPINGVIKEKKVSIGDYVKNATPLFSLITIDPLKLEFSITEREAGLIKVGQEVSFQVDAFPERVFSGRIRVIYPHVDEKTRSLGAEALIPNPQAILKPGFFARLTIYLGPPRPTLVIPANAVLYDESKTKVFVVEKGRAMMREVTIGSLYGDMQEIQAGLKENELVVTVGQNNLADGVKVNVAR